jgi:hypothetical protein
MLQNMTNSPAKDGLTAIPLSVDPGVDGVSYIKTAKEAGWPLDQTEFLNQFQSESLQCRL